MTNLHSYAGSIVWAAIAALLLVATFEPVQVNAAAKEVQLSQKADVAADQAAL